MTMPNQSLWALTEKEKQTLRLIVRGHDAKSTARSLGLSVHTINERLRDARRKMAVSSSREAARLLLETEGSSAGAVTPDLFGDMGIGEDTTGCRVDQGSAPIGGAGRQSRLLWIIIGVLLMTFALGLLAFAALPNAASAPPAPVASDATPDAQVVDAARQFLILGDQSNCAEAYQATSATFHKMNTPQVWTAACEKVRVPLGAMLSRTFVSEEFLPAPPHGYEVVKFRTRFANKDDALETVTLVQEDGGWRVAGVMIE